MAPSRPVSDLLFSPRPPDLVQVAGPQRHGRGAQQAAGAAQGRGRQPGGAAGDDAGLVEADQGEEQADPHREGVLQARRNGLGQPRADAGQCDQQEHDAAHEHGSEHLRPAGADRGQAEGDERVLAHVGRHRDRPVGVERHQQAAEGGGEDGRDGAGTGRDAGEGEDRRVDDHDVGHRGEGGGAAEQLAPRAGAVGPQVEQPLQHRAYSIPAAG